MVPDEYFMPNQLRVSTSMLPTKQRSEHLHDGIQGDNTTVASTASSSHALVQLQKRYGNRYVQRVVKLSHRHRGKADLTRELAQESAHVVQQNGERVQTKLTLGQPGDRYEQAADSVPRALLQMEQQVGQQQVKPEEQEKEKPIQAKLGHGQLQRQTKEKKKEEEPSTPKDPKQVAHDLITSFDAEKGSGGAFSKLSKVDIVSGLRARVNSPQSINQAGLNACGPAAAAYIFASSDPVGYVQMAINLFKAGVARYHQYTVKAGSDLRSHGPDDYKWPSLIPEPVDWMVLSSLRDAENWLYDFEGNPSEDFSAITLPGEMCEWLKDFLGFKTVEDDTNLSSRKRVEHLQQVVNPKYSAGTIVLLFINANLLGDTTKKSAKKSAKKSKAKGGKILAAFPNHFVVLESEATVNLEEDNIEMKVWTWGGNINVSCNKEVFESNYYGAIFAKR